MVRINWRRVALCGVVTGVVWTVLSAISTWYVGADFNSAVPGNKIFAPSAGLAAFLLTVNLAGGIWAMWLYAAIRPRYGAGAKTAAVAGFSWWVVSTLADATWGSFGFAFGGISSGNDRGSAGRRLALQGMTAQAQPNVVGRSAGRKARMKDEL